MIHFVFAAFRTAGLADFSANAAEVLRKLRTAAHKCRRSPAGLGAITVEADALGHFADVRLAQTGIRAVLAFLGTCSASFDAGLMLLMGHFGLSCK
jgi:hypothetical protein